LRAARRAKFFERIGERGANAKPRVTRMHIEHVEDARVLERGEAGDLAVDQRDDGEACSESPGETALIVRAGRPGGALVVVVKILGEHLDASAKQRGETRRVARRTGRSEGGFFARIMVR